MIRLWNTNNSEPSPKKPNPDGLRFNAQVTSLQWSTQCKELLSTHGSVCTAGEMGSSGEEYAFTAVKPNAVTVHAYPALAHVATEYPAGAPVLGSALSPSGCKAAFSVPGEKMIKIWDVWGKRKEPRRLRSMTSGPCGIR
jgi:cell division cycle 20, cofactor of APC complex